MLISEKQIMMLLQSLNEYITVLALDNKQTEEYRKKQDDLLWDILNQQSEQLKVIE